MRLFLFIFIIYTLMSCATQNVVTSRQESGSLFSVLQGATSENETIFRVVYPKALKISYKVIDSDGKELQINLVQSFSRKDSVFKVIHLKATGLTLNKNYTLKLVSREKRLEDSRHFKALDTRKKQMSFLVASCMSDSYNEVGNVMWPKAFAHNPDVTFLIGDNIYADVFSGLYLGSFQKITPKHMWNRYVDHAMKLKIYFMKKLTPTYVTWDDHDFGINDGGKAYPYIKESKKMLNTFFGRQKSNQLNYGPGVSSLVQLGGMNFFFLDGRSFRDQKGKVKGSHFGLKQRNWIKRNLNKSKLNWLISGDQFFGGYHPYESFQGDHKVTFQSFLTDIKKSQALVGFLSGDRHLLEVMKIPKSELGFETYEYTVSGIQTKMYPGSLAKNENPYRESGFDGVANYAILKTDRSNNVLKTSLEGFSASGKELKAKHTYKFN